MRSNNHFNLALITTLSLVALTTLALLASSDPSPGADNVCNHSMPIQEDLMIDKPVQYEIKVQGMCGILPCLKTRLETRTDQTIKTIVKYVTRATCCPGYVETPTRRCVPACLESCNNGAKCVAPNVCKCQPEPSDSKPGFVGPTCNRLVCLAGNRWGSQCERQCHTPCMGNSYCSADTGKCLCYPGWHGPNCSLECDETSIGDGCDESNKLPPIVEPDANLLSNLVISRTNKPEALTFGNGGNDEVKVVPKVLNEAQAWSSFASSYIIGLLSVMSLILLVAFLIVKRRYEFVRNQLYYASATGASSGSDYSDSSYYSRPRPALSPSPHSNDQNPEKNHSFATATRNILSGIVGDGARDKPTNRRAMDGVILIAPRVESHLIASQKASEKNVYSDVDLTKSLATRARAETPPMTIRANEQNDYDNHVYQVPKVLPFLGAANDKLDKSASNEFSQKSHETSVEIGDDDDDSNIYEEIKPRGKNL